MIEFINNIKEYLTDSKEYILEDGEPTGEPSGIPVNTTDQIAPYTKRVGEQPAKRRKKIMKDKLNFSTIDTKDSKLTVNEFNQMKYTNTAVLVPLDEEEIEYKLLNFDEYGMVYENHVIVNKVDKKVYVESNSKETVHLLLTENQKSYQKMRLPEMRHIFSLVKSLCEGYHHVIVCNDVEYNVRF